MFALFYAHFAYQEFMKRGEEEIEAERPATPPPVPQQRRSSSRGSSRKSSASLEPPAEEIDKNPDEKRKIFLPDYEVESDEEEDLEDDDEDDEDETTIMNSYNNQTPSDIKDEALSSSTVKVGIRDSINFKNEARFPTAHKDEPCIPTSPKIAVRSSNFKELATAPSNVKQEIWAPTILKEQAKAPASYKEEAKAPEEDYENDDYEDDQDDFIPIFVTRAAKMVDAETMTKLEAGFKKLSESDSKSLLKKYLTKDVFEKLKGMKTPSFGSSLLDCIQSGVENLDSGCGIYAPDAESYTVFAELFDPIIEDYHQGFKKSDKHPAKEWGDVDSLGNLDPTGEFVISTRVRCGRSMEGYPFNPCLTEAQYKEMEEKVSSTLSAMTGELKGTYYPLTGMTKETQQKLIDDHFLFKEGDRFLQAANACRFWPSGRGIYHNDNKTFLVWCNEEDHLRLISMQMGGDLGQVYRRLVTAVNDIEKRVPFSHNERLGFLTFCPTNLGTTVRASVHIKVPKLASNKAKLEEVAAKFNLQVRGTRGEHTEAEGGVYDISNKRRMGLTEYQAVKEMHDGILEIIKMEKEL